MGIKDIKCSDCLREFYLWLCRFWGLITSFVLWGIGVEAAFYHHYVGYIIVIEAVIVTFLEVVYFINFCVNLCKSEDEDEPESTCLKCWGIFLWFDNWKKGVLYLILAVPCFIQPKEVWLGIISGVMLIISAIFYIIKTYWTMHEETHEKLSQNTTYDRFDEIQEDIEDNILNPSDRQPIMGVADQAEILEL